MRGSQASRAVDSVRCLSLNQNGQIRQTDPSRSESFVGDALRSFDAAVSEVGGEALAARPADPCQSLVVRNQGQSTPVV